MKSSLESKGYRQATESEKPDFIVVIRGSNEYKTSETGPMEYSVPTYQPSTKSTSTVTNPYGGIIGTIETTTQGQWTTEKHIFPSVTVGRYYPFLQIRWMDTKSGKWVFVGNACCASKQPDPQLSCQADLYEITNKMPGEAIDDAARIGIDFKICTVDGNSLYPLVMVKPNSPADRAGLKDYDIITAIDKMPCVDKSWSEINDMLAANTEPTYTFWVIRGKEYFEVKVKKTN